MSDYPEQIDHIRARAEKATPGPWGWFGNTKSNEVYLATRHWGRHLVMGFRRWGMHSAQPEFWTRDDPQAMKENRRTGSKLVLPGDSAVYEVAPYATSADNPDVYRHDLVGIRNADATFIAHSREDVDYLLKEVDRLSGLLREAQGVFPEVGEVRQVAWYCEHRYGTPDANTHMEWDHRKGKLVRNRNTNSALAYANRPGDREMCPAARPLYVRTEASS